MARRWDDTADENKLQNPLPPTQYGVTDEEKAKWNNKQDALEFDDEPTEFSSKMLNSSVVFTALKKVQNTITSAYRRYVDVVLDDLPNIPAFTKLADLVSTMHEKVGSIDKKVDSIDEKVTNYPDPNSKADKNNTVLTGSVSLGRKTGTNVGASSFAVGHDVTARAKYSHAEGWETKAHAPATHAEGYQTSAGHANATDSVGDGWYAHAEGQGSEATHRAAHAEGCLCKANADFAHAEGNETTVSANAAHAEGYKTHVTGDSAHAEGQVTAAAGSASHAEGNDTLAQSKGCHAEGSSTVAGNTAQKTGISALELYEVGSFAHSQGIGTLAKGSAAHAEGYKTRAEGAASHSEGDNTVAAGNYQHTQGRYNAVDFNNQYAHIVGGGTSDTARKNIHTVDWQGTAEYAGDVIAQGCDNTGVEPVSLLDVGIRLNNLEGTSRNSVFEEITINHPNMRRGFKMNVQGGVGSSSDRAFSVVAADEHCVFHTQVNAGDVFILSNKHKLATSGNVGAGYAPTRDIIIINDSYPNGYCTATYRFIELETTPYKSVEITEPGEIWVSFNTGIGDYYTEEPIMYVRRKKGTTPIVLYASDSERYLEDTVIGDEVLHNIIAGKQVYVRVPNADDNIYTAIYSPVYMYQLPNFENGYLYLFYLTDEQQDLNPLLGIPVKIPTYGELKLKLSKEYNQTPLW